MQTLQAHKLVYYYSCHGTIIEQNAMDDMNLNLVHTGSCLVRD